ncbi:MAG: Demethylrebeccamycin-D-glucose O-methyltransferase [Bacteroidetes bacterium ADurb.Bin408]|nr:MAG: Demethylrebeccamycin-D-glucose O-methyltransferase [Bacteroidetes bacterium ADurb.Bin408]
MQYDPIKKSLGKVFNNALFLRKLFYKLLDLLLLRSWYIRRAVRIWQKGNTLNARILDAGSGFGQYSYFLQTLNKKWHITGVDVKTEQIEDCNNFFSKAGFRNVRFEYADLTAYKPNENFDLILCVDVMEHIEDDISVFNTFSKILNPGGLLLISTPSDKGGSDVHYAHDASFIDEHVRDGYNKEDITQKLKQAGFSKVEVIYSYGKYGKAAWKISMKYPITLLNASKLFFILLPFYYIILFPVAFILNILDINTNNAEGTGIIVKAYK